MSIKIKNARLSFPSLFQHSIFAGQSTGKFEATFILDKVEHAGAIKQVKAAIATMAKTELKGKVASDKVCLKDGDELDREEFHGAYTLKASTNKRPLLIDRDKSPLVEDDGKPYAGCYVNGIFRLWAQNNNYGKRINAQLDGIQFYADGEPFGGGNSVSVGAFDAFDDDDDDDDDEF